MLNIFYDVGMPWSTTRQLLFALGAIAIVGAVVVGTYFFFFFTPASCFDGALNQDETGIDCGGSCSQLCTQPNISTLWSRSVRVAPGVYHAAGLIKNPDTSAQGTVSYTVSLFDADNILVATRAGEIELLPGDLAPLFEANIVTGERIPARTFIDIGTGAFERKERAAPSVRILSFELNEELLTVTTVIENQTAISVTDIEITAFLFNDAELLINASQTRIDRLDARERKEVVFTWQEPFSEPPSRIDILPRVIE